MPTGLPPVVDGRTRVVVLGSMPGEVSLQKQQYYAHPRNAFWRIMSDLIGFDTAAAYPARLGGLLSAGIGLWDVLRICDRPGVSIRRLCETRWKSTTSGVCFATPRDFAGVLQRRQGGAGVPPAGGAGARRPDRLHPAAVDESGQRRHVVQRKARGVACRGSM